MALALVLLVAPALTVVYERAYVGATGDSFLAFYTGPRLNPEAVAGGAMDRVGYNTIWYTARLAWYAFPWSLMGLAASSWGALSAAAGSDGGPARADGRGQRGSAGHAVCAGAVLLFAVAASFLLIVLFSFSDRKADRFIFPAYYFMAAAGGVTAIRCSPAVSRVVDRLDRPVGARRVLDVALRAAARTGSHLPQFTFWRS